MLDQILRKNIYIYIYIFLFGLDFFEIYTTLNGKF